MTQQSRRKALLPHPIPIPIQAVVLPGMHRLLAHMRERLRRHPLRERVRVEYGAVRASSLAHVPHGAQVRAPARTRHAALRVPRSGTQRGERERASGGGERVPPGGGGGAGLGAGFVERDERDYERRVYALRACVRAL